MILCASATRTGDEDFALGRHAKRDADADLIIRAHLRPWNRLPLNDDGSVHLTWSSLSVSARYTTRTHIDNFYVRPPPIPSRLILDISDIRERAPQVLLRGECVHTSRTRISRTRVVFAVSLLTRRCKLLAAHHTTGALHIHTIYGLGVGRRCAGCLSTISRCLSNVCLAVTRRPRRHYQARRDVSRHASG